MLEHISDLSEMVKKDIDVFIDSLVQEPFDNNSLKSYGLRAPEIMYMAMCILNGKKFERVEDYKDYSNRQIQSELLTPLKYLRKANPVSYAYGNCSGYSDLKWGLNQRHSTTTHGSYYSFFALT